MSDFLRELVGREVSVWTINSGPGHSGTLRDVGKRWIHLVSDPLGTLLMPTQNIRLLKITQGGMKIQIAEGELQPSLIGQTVSISSGAEGSYSDTGELEAFDNEWLRMRVKNAQLYFAVSSILELRMV